MKMTNDFRKELHRFDALSQNSDRFDTLSQKSPFSFFLQTFGVDIFREIGDSYGTSIRLVSLDPMPTPQIFDFLTLILIGWLTLRGALRGIVVQIMSIVSVVVSWIIAVKFSPIVAPMVSDDPPWNRLIAMSILFVASFLAMWLIRGLMNDIIKTIRLKSADRSLGAVLGFAKGVLICLIITFFLVVFSPTTRNFVLESISGKYFARGVERISVLIPKEASEVLSKGIAKFNGILEENSVSDAESPIKPLDNLGHLKELGTQIFSDKVTQTVGQIKGEISGVLPLKDIEPQSSPVPSPLREKVGSTPIISVESPEPTAPPRRVVLPFQPGR